MTSFIYYDFGVSLDFGDFSLTSNAICNIKKIVCSGEKYRKIAFVSQRKRYYNICGIRMDYGVQYFKENTLE